MIDKLEFFILLAREKHFGKAAEAAGVTQPTLSAAIRQLEAHLGVLLVERGSRFKGLTPEGQRVLGWAHQIVGDARTLRDEMRGAKSGLSGTLRLGVIPTALTHVPDLTAPYMSAHPQMRLSVRSMTSEAILRGIETLEIDAGITYLEGAPLERVTALPLYQESFNLITTRGAPLSDRAEVSWADVAELNLCLLSGDMQNRRIINAHFASAGVQPAPMLESNSMIVLQAHVLAGGWASIMPVDLAGTLGAAGDIIAVPIGGPDAMHPIGLVAAKREPHRPQVASLLNIARRIGNLS